jgi:hypothetical protein
MHSPFNLLIFSNVNIADDFIIYVYNEISVTFEYCI